MGVIGNIIVRVGADINPMQRGLQQAQASLRNAQRTLSGLSGKTQSSMGGVAAASGIARTALISLGIAAATAFAIIGKKSISAAMDTVESESLFTVSMGNMAQSARDWSNQLQDSLGLNGYEVRKNVGLFYNMTTSMGLAQQKAYEVSTGITKLAYDMSSFYNISPDEMFTKLQSGLSGEVEPLKRLGIIVNEANVKNYAYAHGIGAMGAELTEQQKVMARYAYIMSVTGNAQGDLARTIMSPTNQLRIFQMQLQLAQINLGNAFMPILQTVMPILVDFAKALVTVTNTFSQFMQTLFGTNTVQSQNATSATQAAKAQDKLATATTATNDAIQKGVAGFDEVNQLQDEMSNSSSDAADAIKTPNPDKQGGDSAISKGVIDLVKDFKPAIESLSKAWDGLTESVASLWATIQPVLIPLKEAIFDIIKNSLQMFINVIKSGLDYLNGLVKIIDGLIKGDPNKVIDGLALSIKGVYENLKSITTWAFPDTLQLFSDLESKINKSWEDYKQHNPSTYNIAGWIKEMWGASSLGTWISTSWDGFTESIATIWDKYKSTYGNGSNFSPFNLAQWIRVLWETSGLGAWVSKAWDGLVDSISAVWTKYKSKHGNGSEESHFNISQWIKFLWESSGIGDWIGKAWDKFVESMSTIWTKFKDGTVLFNIAQWISDTWTKTKDSLFKTIIDDLNKLVDWLNSKFSINIPANVIPGITSSASKFGLNIPQIPQLGNGGITSGPTLAQIGEAGREAVIPLENSSFIDSFASTIGTAVIGAMQFNQPSQAQTGNIVIQIDSTQLARVMIPAISRENSRLGNSAILRGV